MTEIFEHDRKLTMTYVNLLNLTKKFKKNCHDDEHEQLNMTKNNNPNEKTSYLSIRSRLLLSILSKGYYPLENEAHCGYNRPCPLPPNQHHAPMPCTDAMHGAACLSQKCMGRPHPTHTYPNYMILLLYLTTLNLYFSNVNLITMK